MCPATLRHEILVVLVLAILPSDVPMVHTVSIIALSVVCGEGTALRLWCGAEIWIVDWDEKGADYKKEWR